MLSIRVFYCCTYCLLYVFYIDLVEKGYIEIGVYGEFIELMQT